MDHIRRELEQAYAANEAGFVARDADAVMRLRHPDFHTVDHTGKLSTRQQMDERTRSLIARIERFDSIRETIRALEVHGDTAIAKSGLRRVRKHGPRNSRIALPFASFCARV
jgi:hypothetical protein